MKNSVTAMIRKENWQMELTKSAGISDFKKALIGAAVGGGLGLAFGPEGYKGKMGVIGGIAGGLVGSRYGGEHLATKMKKLKDGAMVGDVPHTTVQQLKRDFVPGVKEVELRDEIKQYAKKIKMNQESIGGLVNNNNAKHLSSILSKMKSGYTKDYFEDMAAATSKAVKSQGVGQLKSMVDYGMKNPVHAAGALYGASVVDNRLKKKNKGFRISS